MAAYDSLKSLVQQAIRTNGNNEITGQVLQNVLMAMIDELGGENGYAGVATPSTNPGAPDGKVFYFATEAGTYTHFDGATLAKGIHLLVFNGVTWSHQTLYTIDSEVTSGSNNLITSGAVYTKIINAINALDATVSKSAGADGLSLSLTETDGKVTSISGSIAPQTYDAYGAASAAQIAAATDATNKVNAAKTQILGDAASDYNTLGKLEDKIQAEASRAAAAESALNTAKADKATTLAGYGINDAYTKTEVNGLVSTPHQNYVTVPTYASLPATGSADTIYRVSNYNGSTNQVDASVYSEYAWNGSGYTFLRVVSQIGEVFDITVYNSNTKYADLAAALGTNGANVPSSIRRGGMSVKFVQSSDNKYVQYRLMSDSFNTIPSNWQGVDDEPTAKSRNLVESGGVYTKITNAKEVSIYGSAKKQPVLFLTWFYEEIQHEDNDVFDISAYNLTNGQPTPYSDIEEAIGNNGDNIPERFRSPGMEVKFIKDDKYVKFFYIGTSVTGTPNPFLDTENWQGVDEEPTDDSKNLITSGGVSAGLKSVQEKCSAIGESAKEVSLFSSSEQFILYVTYFYDEICRDNKNVGIEKLDYLHIIAYNSQDDRMVAVNYWYEDVINVPDNNNKEESNCIFELVYPNSGKRTYLVNYWYDSESSTESLLDAVLPQYIFGVELGNNRVGIEYFVNVYPEACIKEKIKGITINGNIKALLQENLRESFTGTVKIENKTLTLKAPNYKELSRFVQLIMANRYNAKNKNVQVLCIGDSITEQNPYLTEDIKGSWVMNIGKMAAVDDICIGDINIGLVGTRNIVTQSVTFNNQTRSVRCCSEGRSGWPTYSYLNWPIYVRCDGPSNVYHFMGPEGMFYALGLSTKTPFNSSTPGQDAKSYSASDIDEIIKTPFGRYKIDYNASLWNQLKVYTDFSGEGDYNPSTSPAIIQAWFDGKISNPDNPFFDIDKVQEYTGTYVWAHNNAFSIDKYLERYRTCDDLGVVLTGSAGETVTGSDGETYIIGTKVQNTSNYKVCTPTHVITALGTNDFGMVTLLQSSQLQYILQTAINEELDDVEIGYWLPRSPGVVDVNMWQDYGYPREMPDYTKVVKNILFENLHPVLGNDNVTYIPGFYTMSPLGASPLDRFGIDLDDITETKKLISGSDGTHPSALGHRSAGYECLGWLYWTLR